MLRVSLRAAEPEDSEFAFQTRKAAFRPILESVSDWDELQERQRHARQGAIQFYERLGFVSTGVDDTHVTMLRVCA